MNKQGNRLESYRVKKRGWPIRSGRDEVYEAMKKRGLEEAEWHNSYK